MEDLRKNDSRLSLLLFYFGLGLFYFIYGLITIETQPDYKITNLPAGVRRAIDGLFIMVLSLIAKKNKNKRPWKILLRQRKLMFYATFSLILHYGGMISPFDIYDSYPFFNRLMHMNASMVILLIFYYGFSQDSKTTLSLLTGIIGIIWEILEYLTLPPDLNYWTVINIAYGWYDTKLDLLFNAGGIFIGLLIISFNKIGDTD